MAINPSDIKISFTRVELAKEKPYYIDANSYEIYDRQYHNYAKTNGELPVTCNDNSNFDSMAGYLSENGTTLDTRLQYFIIKYNGAIVGQIKLGKTTGQWYLGSTQFSGTYNHTDNFIGGNYRLTIKDSTYNKVQYSYCTTNIPIFMTKAEAMGFLNGTVDISTALNYLAPEVTPDGSDFEIINMWTHGIWLNDTQPQVSAIYNRDFRAKIVDGLFALYIIPGIDDGKLKYGIKSNAEFYQMQYSTDGLTWIDTDTFPYEYFLRKRTNELGEFDYGLTFNNSMIPIFEDEQTAQDYLDELIDITEAVNWDEISGKYPILNGTGVDDSQSDFGEVKTRGFFSQQYILDDVCLQALANDLFDTSIGGIWEAIKKGLDMYGDSPIEAVMGLSFWPVDLSSMFTSSTAPYIWFGGYGWEPSAGVAKKITYPNGYKSVGSVKIVRTFKSWRDFEPYTKLYVMLPYCGTYQLDLARYYDKNVEVRYYFDTRTNGCIACLIADGFLVDYFNGQAGVTMPITLTDYSAYMNAQISTLLGGGGQAVQTFGNAAAQAPGIAAGAMGAGAIAATGAGVAVGGAVIGAKTVYGLAQNNINNFNKTKGGSSSMINEYLPQSVCFIFEIQEDCAPDNYGEMFGYPSMKSGKIYNFSGFLKCQSVKLNCSIATENERERLKQMLLSGIYI